MSFTEQPAAREGSISYINDDYLADEERLVGELAAAADTGKAARRKIGETAAQLVKAVRKNTSKEGGIEAFLRREVLPYGQDAWYDPDSVKTGYEISFTRYFYKPQPMRRLEEIRADILSLEKETEGLLDEILGITSS